MKNVSKILSLLFIALFLCGCTDAFRGKIKALGNSALIQCYSGGELIYEGKSTGKIQSESQSDGYYFQDELGFVKEVSGDCIITYDKTP